MWTITFFALICCMLIWWLQRLHDKFNCLPPGPFRFPLVGCIFQVLWQHPTLPFIAFQKMAKSYGDILYIQLGVVKAVVIIGYEANKAILTNEDCIGRTQEKWQLGRTFGNPAYGLIFSDVDSWRETRRFCVKNLRDFGFGIKVKMEVHIADEAKQFCQSIKQRIGDNKGIFQIQHFFDLPVLNSSWTMINGQPFAQNDPEIFELLNILHEFFKSCSIGAGLLTAYPFLVDIAPTLVHYDKQTEANIKFQNYFRKTISKARAKGQYKNNPSNFIETFLQQIDEVQQTKPGNLIYSDENLISILYDIFLGATETTSNTLSFGILYLILNPDVQERVAHEVHQVIGRNRLPNMDDRQKMPYTQATILEIFRVSNVAPLSPRRAYKDITLGPYKIPEGTTIYLNYWSVSRDETIWVEPEIFRPERFLDEKQNVINEDKMLSFAIGKRNCIGEMVAKTTFFILLTGLLQQFKFEINEDDGKPSATPQLGLTLFPKPFSFVVKLREWQNLSQKLDSLAKAKTIETEYSTRGK